MKVCKTVSPVRFEVELSPTDFSVLHSELDKISTAFQGSACLEIPEVWDLLLKLNLDRVVEKL